MKTSIAAPVAMKRKSGTGKGIHEAADEAVIEVEMLLRADDDADEVDDDEEKGEVIREAAEGGGDEEGDPSRLGCQLKKLTPGRGYCSNKLLFGETLQDYEHLRTAGMEWLDYECVAQIIQKPRRSQHWCSCGSR
jgi:hypothetical protein